MTAPWWMGLLLLPALSAQQGEIRGSVASSTGEPLASVEISLTANSGGTEPAPRARRWRTAADGKFVFRELELGAYALTFSKDGFEAGARVSRTLDVDDSRPEAAIDVRLRRSSAVAGRVTDPDGDPIPDVTVQLRSWNTSLGLRSLRPVKVARTNDLGEYRLYGLAPGKYVVSATPLNLPAPRGVLAYELGALHYPAAADVLQATPLPVAWNQEVSGIDFRFSYSPATSIEGVVFGLDGSGCDSCLVNILGPGGTIEGSVAATDQGLFAIRGLPPGSYDLAVNSRRGRGSALAHVAVADERVAEAVLTLSTGRTVSGRVTVADPADATQDKVVVALRPASGLFAGRRLQAEAALGGDGIFEIAGAGPGEYSIALSGLPPGAYLDRVLRDGRPIPDAILRVGDETAISGLALRLSLDGGSVHGKVLSKERAADGLAAPPGLVVLIPFPYGKNGRYERLGSYRLSDGLFEITGVAPGIYDLVAVSRENTFDIGDAGDLELLRRRAKRVRVAAGAAVQADAPFVGSGP